MSSPPTKTSKAKGIVPAVCSGLLPGLGQLVNGDKEKAIGVFVVAAGAGIATALPLVGGIAGVIAGGTWLYGVADGYFGARRKRRRR